MSDAELKRLVQEAKKNESKIQANIEDKKRKELEAFEREWNLLIGPSGKMTIRQRSAEGGAKKIKKEKN